METQRFVLQSGFVLHQRAYGENHAILELFTRVQGRAAVVARGVRSPKSRRRALLQPFTPLLLSWHSRGELGTLTAVEAAGTPLWLHGRALISGLYLNELLMRLLRRDDPHPQLFDIYADTLRALADCEDEAGVLRTFERDLLEQVGYGLLLDSDSEGEAIDPKLLYDYRLDAGPVRAMGSGGVRIPVHGDSLRALAAGRLQTPRQQREIKHLMRQALALHLGDRPLKSRELYAQHLRRGSSVGGKHAEPE